MVNHDYTYINMVDAILDHEAVLKENRTNTPTIGITGYHADYSVNMSFYDEDESLVINNFPLLTTKKMFFKGIVAELIWLLNGQTNIRFLEQHGVHIWMDWPYRNYTNNNPDKPLTKKEFCKLIVADARFAATWGELGPVYGKQWRKWATLESEEYGGKEIDQIAINLETLLKNPASRRNITSAWNVADIKEMEKSGLPPCHTMFHLLTTPNSETPRTLDLLLYQRSMDVFLGAPFNIPSYTLLLAMFAEYAGMMPGKFIHMIGDCHIYVNHIEQMKEQRARVPYRSPSVTIRKGFMEKMMEKPINDPNLDYEELAAYIVLENYQAHDSIHGEVAV